MNGDTQHDDNPSHPPLAHDASGNRLAVPEGTNSWRVCRQTTGRPRTIVGPDNEPMRFPLHLTRDQLADLCGGDTYRVYALDDVGGVLDYVTTVTAGLRPRNAAPDIPAFALTNVPLSLPATTDMRYALETIAHVARTNADAMRAIAESQADWIKTIAAAKGLPRNLTPAQLVPPPSDFDDDEDDFEEHAEQSSSEKESGIEAVLRQVAPFVPGLMADWRGNKANTSTTASSAIGHLVRIQKRLSSKEREMLAALLDDPESGEAVASDFATKSVDEVVTLIRRSVREQRPAPPNTEQLLRERLPAVLQRLDPAEQARLIKLAPALAQHKGSHEAQAVLEKLAPMTVDEAAAWLKQNLDDIEKRFAS